MNNELLNDLRGTHCEKYGEHKWSGGGGRVNVSSHRDTNTSTHSNGFARTVPMNGKKSGFEKKSGVSQANELIESERRALPQRIQTQKARDGLRST